MHLLVVWKNFDYLFYKCHSSIHAPVPGVVLATFGLLIAGLSIEYLDPPSLIVFYITVGVMTGLGFGFMYLAAMDIIELYFDK